MSHGTQSKICPSQTRGRSHRAASKRSRPQRTGKGHGPGGATCTTLSKGNA